MLVNLFYAMLYVLIRQMAALGVLEWSLFVVLQVIWGHSVPVNFLAKFILDLLIAETVPTSVKINLLFSLSLPVLLLLPECDYVTFRYSLSQMNEWMNESAMI